MIKLPDAYGQERNVRIDQIRGTSLNPLGDGLWKLRIYFAGVAAEWEAQGSEPAMRAIVAQITGEAATEVEAKVFDASGAALNGKVDQPRKSDDAVIEAEQIAKAVRKELIKPEAEKAAAEIHSKV